MNVSRETTELFKEYTSLLRKWNTSINLVAPATLSDFNRRHIQDSLQVYERANPQKNNWADFGSGGGLPGVIIAILGKPHSLNVTLVESDKRKSAFLLTVKRCLGLDNLIVKTSRIESLVSGDYDYISARALAPLRNLMPHLHKQLTPDGEAWLLKGKSWKKEVNLASYGWSFELETYSSVTDPESVVIKLRNIEPNA